MKIIQVLDKKLSKRLLSIARYLYRDDPVWVCPLDREINAIFDPAVNVFFKHGVAQRWILLDDKGMPAGRIAAFIDHHAANLYDQPTGGMGFFECIHDQEAANMLFDTAKNWLAGRGMEAMDGPINFGETDKYWGLLVGGFTHPSYEIAYNHRYYRELFENYGFRTYYMQEGFHLDLKKPLPERFIKIADWVSRKPGYEFRHFRWKDAEKLSRDFVEVYNITWASFKENFTPLTAEYIHKTLKKARAIMEDEFNWIAYHNEKPIAIYLMYPDVNQILKHLNGRLNLTGKLKFLYLKQRKTMTRARGVLMGVIPTYQGRGIEAAIILNLAKVFESKTHYHEIEFSWVGDFNPKMRKVFLSVGSVPVKNYITFRYLFDRSREFKRFPIP
jgi:hypothetical protein